MNNKEKIINLKRNAIICELERTDEIFQTGTKSKIGGRPFLPKGLDWFRNTCAEGEKKGTPLSFIAQFNMEELREFDLDNMLPKKGILYFFYDLYEEPIGCMAKERNGAKIYFYDGEWEQLEEKDFPEDLDENFRIPQFDVHFTTRYEAPMCEEYREIIQEDIGFDEYNNDLDALNLYQNNDEEVTKILGYADLCQGSMLLQCEMIRNNIDCNDFEHLKYQDEYIDAAGDWILLFQVDTISDSDFELMFGDCGRLYYYIRKEDLKEKKFENGWLVSQCY